MTSHRDVVKALHNSGWEIWYDYFEECGQVCQARQGGMKTPWRSTPEQVLADVRRIVEPDPHQGRNEDDARLSDR